MTTPDESGREAGAKRSPRWGRRAAVFAGGLVLLLALLFAAVRFGAMAPPTSGLIEARTDGLAIGRFGNLKIEGLRGDLFSDLRIRRLTIADEKGVWLEAKNIELEWRYLELLRRRFHAERLEIEALHLIRRPILTPKKDETGGLPVALIIDRAALRLEMSEAFSYERGVYEVAGAVSVRRRGRGQSGEVHARSLLRPGDRLDAVFDIGRRRPLLIDVTAVEAQGGALAGAAGFDPKAPFSLRIDARGRIRDGRFEALARTGGQTPLRASGAWSSQGGRADGRLNLAASRLTQGIARRVGDQVEFQVSGAQAEGDLMTVNARLTAPRLTVRATGLADPDQRRTGPQGVSLVAETQDLSALAGGGTAGAARLSGVLRGAPDDLDLQGQLRVQALGAGGYRLAQVAGPVTLSRDADGIELDLALNGQGGAGDGYLAALLGQTPSLEGRLQRLADGRLLVRDLQVEGAGIDLEAQGDRGLLGGLSFSADARVSNLSAARSGAAGAAQLELRGARRGADAPWRFEVDGRGQDLALGFAQLDRLLGGSPRLEVRADYQAGRLGLERAQLTGQSLQARSAGVYGPDGQLRFNLDWSAEGPVHAGPAEFTGEAEGSGAITGTLTAPQVDLRAQFDEIDVPRLPLRDAELILTFGGPRAAGLAGRASLNAESAYGPARARAGFALPQGGVDLRNVDITAGGAVIEGDLSLRRATPSRADLTVRVGPGAFLQRGEIDGRVRVVDGAEAPVADILLTGEDVVLAGSDVAIVAARLTARGPIDQLAYELSASGGARGERWDVTGGGALAEAESARTLTFMGRGGYGGRELSTRDPAIFRFGGGERSAQLALRAADGGLVEVDARLAGAIADIELRARNLGLEILNPDLAGRVNANLTLAGRDGRLEGALSARLADARGRGSPRVQGLDAAVDGTLDDDVIRLEASASNEQGLRAELNLALPAEASAQPFRLAVDRRRPVEGRLVANGEVEPLWDLLIDGDRTLSGGVRLSGRLSGTLADPVLTGQAAMQNGRFQDAATGLTLEQIGLEATLAERTIEVSEARAVDGTGGRLDGSGQISLYRGGVSGFRMRLDGFRLIDNDLAQADASGDVTINRNAQGRVRLAGALTIDGAEVAADPPTPSGVVTMEVIERNRPLELDLRQNLGRVRQRGEGWALDVSLKAPRGVFIRGRGLDVEMSLDAQVSGTTARPNLTGVARVVRGDYEFAGKRFEFDTRGTVQLSTSPQNIRLDLTATRDDPTLTAVIRVNGTAAQPRISLTSNPVLPDDEVLSQVLFGRSASQLSGIEAAQLAAALSSLAGGGGFDVVGNLREFAGLDRLSLGGDEASGVTVAGGKYLTDDVYLEIIGGGRDGATAQVEWQVRRNLSIISRLTGQGDSRLAVRWRRDY